MRTKRARGAVAALAVGAGLALVAGAPAGAGTDGISGSANWSVPAAEPGATVTLTGGYQNGAPGAASYVIQLSISGGGNGLITSFTNSANLTGCTPTNGIIITCTWNATAQNESATITATVVVPAGSVNQEWQGDATWENMLLGTDIFEVIAPNPTVPETTTTTTVPVTTAPGETPTTGEAATTTAAASGGGTATTRPRSTALPATGSSSSGLVIAAFVSLLAGILVVTAARRRPLP